MDIFVKKAIENFRGLTACNVAFNVGDKKIEQRLRFYFAYMKEDDIFYIISLDFISMEKINNWSKVESSTVHAVVSAINESISSQLSFFVAYYRDNFDNKENLGAINRNISKTLNLFYGYMKLKSKISKSLKKISNDTMHKMENTNYEGMHEAITYMEI